jgi:hypothetical protein
MGLVASLAFAVTTEPAGAQTCLDPDADGILWQIGQEEGPVEKAELGALEYPANDTWVAVAEYTATGIDTAPDFPGYLADKRLSEILEDLGFPERTPTDAAEQIVISWEQCRGLGLVIEYGRYGSEEDAVTLDGESVEGLSAGGENVDAVVESDPLTIEEGGHSLTITYVGAGVANGHYIDYLRARVVACEGPENPYAVPDGYTFISPSRTPQILTVDVPEGSHELVASVGQFNCSLRPGNVIIEGFASIPSPLELGEVVSEVIGVAEGPGTLAFTVSVDGPISVGVKIEAIGP